MNQYSTQKNITTSPPETDSKNVTARYITYPDNTAKRQAEGGLRLQGKYKQSIENKPLITVITIALNNAVGLEETIKSVINQTYDNIEYIVIDGGSSDNTLAILGKYKDAIDYFISEPDGGIYHAMNKGIELSSGNYLIFMNSSDIFFNKNVIKDIFEDKSYDTDIIFGNGSNKGIKTKHPLPLNSEGYLVLENFFKGYSLCHQASFISKNLFNVMGFYNTFFKIVSDHYFFILALKKYGASYLYIPLDIAIVDITGISTNIELLQDEIKRMSMNISINKTKRILFVHPHNFFNKETGTDNYIYEIVKSISKCDNIQIELIGVEQEKMWDNFEYQNKIGGNIIKNLTLVNFGNQATEKELIKFYSDIDMFEKFKDKKYYDYIFSSYSFSNNVLKYFISPRKICITIDFMALQSAYSDNSLCYFHNYIADEINRMSIFDSFIYISYDELAFFSHIFSKPAYFLPHLNKPKEIEQLNPNKILFIGGYNPYNIDAAKWLINEIIPNFKSDIKITIAGKVCEHIEDDIKIEKLGYVNDLDDLYSKTKIVICPMRMGTGMKIKVIEAMSMGIPVITTPLGLDGLPNKMNTGIIVASTALDFADSIEKLSDDNIFYQESREKIKKHYKELYETYNVDSIIKNILEDKPSENEEWWKDLPSVSNIIDTGICKIGTKTKKMTFLEYIFSVYTEEKFVVIYLLGVKISVKRRTR